MPFIALFQSPVSKKQQVLSPCWVHPAIHALENAIITSIIANFVILGLSTFDLAALIGEHTCLQIFVS